MVSRVYNANLMVNINSDLAISFLRFGLKFKFLSGISRKQNPLCRKSNFFISLLSSLAYQVSLLQFIHSIYSCSRALLTSVYLKAREFHFVHGGGGSHVSISSTILLASPHISHLPQISKSIPSIQTAMFLIRFPLRKSAGS